MLKNIGNFNNTNDYLPLFNAVLITDIFVISLLNISMIKSQVLKKWYSQYNLSAVIADVLIILIGLIIARAVYYHIFDKFSLFKFIIIAIIVQIIHDILFYVLFVNIHNGITISIYDGNGGIFSNGQTNKKLFKISNHN